jgi:purine-binding chemotaxis protein CheW
MENAVNKTMPYLTFRLGEESYALRINKVREVLKETKITKIPKTPEYMLGVINLRGGVVSVIDLKMKFGMERVADLSSANIIILELTHNSETLLIGAVVDSVHEVLELDSAAIEGTSRLGMNMDTEFLEGIGKKGDDFIIILDIDKIFSISELTLVTGLKNTAVRESVQTQVQE